MLGKTTLAALSIAAFVAVPAGGAHAATAVPGPCDPTTLSTRLVGPVSIDVGTGETNGTRHAYTTQDDTWTTALPTPGPAYSVEPHASWVAPAGANWINSSTTNASHGGSVVIGVGDGVLDTGSLDRVVGSGLGPVVDDAVASLAGPVGTVSAGTTTTTFRTTFTLPPEVVNRSLNIEYAADNGVTFLLNGHPIGGFNPPVTASIATQQSAFNQYRPLVATAWFQDGLNVLDAVVSDYGVATGVIVRGAVHGCAVRGLDPTTCVTVDPRGSALTYSPVPIDIGTGEDNYVPHAIGAQDPDWRYVTATGSTPTYSVTPNPAWFTSQHANWVNSSADTSTGNDAVGVGVGIGDGGPQVSVVANPPTSGLTRVYRYTFTLPSDFSYGGLQFQYGGDNDVVFRLNTVAVGTAANAFYAPHQVSLPSAPLVPGVNVLEATVTDYGVATGLFVEGGVFACRSGRVQT